MFNLLKGKLEKNNKRGPSCRFLGKISTGSTFLTKKSGQGAIEYLLIIGAAILIAAIVVTILLSTTKKSQNSVDQVYGDFNSIINDINYGLGSPVESNNSADDTPVIPPNGEIIIDGPLEISLSYGDIIDLETISPSDMNLSDLCNDCSPNFFLISSESISLIAPQEIDNTCYIFSYMQNNSGYKYNCSTGAQEGFSGSDENIDTIFDSCDYLGFFPGFPEAVAIFTQFKKSGSSCDVNIYLPTEGLHEYCPGCNKTTLTDMMSGFVSCPIPQITGLNSSNIANITKLSQIYACTNLEKIKLGDNAITGDIKYLKKLTGLTELQLFNSDQITGQINKISDLNKLGALNLSNTQVTGSLADLCSLKNLTKLSLPTSFGCTSSPDCINRLGTACTD